MEASRYVEPRSATRIQGVAVRLPAAFLVAFSMLLPGALEAQVTGIPDSIMAQLAQDRDVVVWVDRVARDGNTLELRRGGGAFDVRGFLPFIPFSREVIFVCRRHSCRVYVSGESLRATMRQQPRTRPMRGLRDVLGRVHGNGEVLELMFEGRLEVTWERLTAALWPAGDVIVLNSGEVLHLGKGESVDVRRIRR